MGGKHILYNFASRSRPERCMKALKNIHLLSNDKKNFTIVLKIDTDDNKVARYARCDQYATIKQGVSISKVHAINRDILVHGWDILVNMSDDIIFKVKGFDDIIRRHCEADDFILFPEPFAAKKSNSKQTGLISVVSIMGYDYYKRDGYVYHPSYLRTHCDNEATEVARIRGRLKQVDVPLFYHEHPAAGYPVGDKLYRMEKDTWDIDKGNYNTRKEAGYP